MTARLESAIKESKRTKILDVSSMNLETLPPLQSDLKVLYCRNNKLTNLPKLPKSLETLDCALNSITSLPQLPGSLIDFDCRANKLKILPRPILKIKRYSYQYNPLNRRLHDLIEKYGHYDGINKYYDEIKNIAKDIVASKILVSTDLNDDVLSVITSFLSGQKGTVQMQLDHLKSLLLN